MILSKRDSEQKISNQKLVERYERDPADNSMEIRHLGICYRYISIFFKNIVGDPRLAMFASNGRC